MFNVTGATRFAGEGLKAGRLVYLGSDPVGHEVEFATGDGATRSLIAEHDDVVTYGENIGTSRCPVPPLPRLRARINVRLRSGWFSERSACYLAAGLPVITQDTGFGDVLPTGKGLFAFQTMEDIAVAADAIQSGYQADRLAAGQIAREFFRAEEVLGRLLKELGL